MATSPSPAAPRKFSTLSTISQTAPRSRQTSCLYSAGIRFYNQRTRALTGSPAIGQVL